MTCINMMNTKGDNKYAIRYGDIRCSDYAKWCMCCVEHTSSDLGVWIQSSIMQYGGLGLLFATPAIPRGTAIGSCTGMLQWQHNTLIERGVYTMPCPNRVNNGTELSSACINAATSWTSVIAYTYIGAFVFIIRQQAIMASDEHA